LTEPLKPFSIHIGRFKLTLTHYFLEGLDEAITALRIGEFGDLITEFHIGHEKKYAMQSWRLQEHRSVPQLLGFIYETTIFVQVVI